MRIHKKWLKVLITIADLIDKKAENFNQLNFIVNKTVKMLFAKWFLLVEREKTRVIYENDK